MGHAHEGRDRSDDSHAVLDAESRRRKARKLISLLNTLDDRKDIKLLDIGTGSGHIADELAKNYTDVTSVDVVDERRVKDSYKFEVVESEKLPFKNGSFDIVVSNHVIEHTPNQKLHMSEMLRVLKNGGVAYVATPNKLWLTDPHFKLPFVSWLPRSLGNAYVQKTRQAEWDVYPISVFGINKLSGDNTVTNLLPAMIRSVDQEVIDQSGGAVRLLQKAPKQLDSLTRFYSPTLIFAITKK